LTKKLEYANIWLEHSNFFKLGKHLTLNIEHWTIASSASAV